MFIILTHDNQSTFSSFSLILSFVTNNHVAEKVLSGSTDLVLIVIKSWISFFKVIWPLPCSLKKTHFLFHNLWSNLFRCWNSYVVFTLKDYMDSVLWLHIVDWTFGVWITCVCPKEHKMHFGVGWVLFYKKWL